LLSRSAEGGLQAEPMGSQPDEPADPADS